MGSDVLSLAVPAASLLGGTIATYWYEPRLPLPWRIPIGACTGAAALGLLAFPLSMRFGLTTPVVIVAAAIVAMPTALMMAPSYRQLLSKDVVAVLRAVRSAPRAATVVRALLYLAGAAVLWLVARRAMFVRADGIYTGVSHNIGDLPFHLTVTNRFLYGANFPPEHPSFAGVGFTYPFLTDFLGATFASTGVSIETIIVWSTWLLCLALAAVLYKWTLDLTGDRDAAFYAPALALLSGGLGWWKLAGDIQQSEAGPWAVLARLPRDYTMTYDHELRWGNLVTTLLVTQRGLLLGLPMALIVFRLWWQGIHDPDSTGRQRHATMAAAGVIAGMLPLVHAHSYAVVVGMGVCVAVLWPNRWRWVPFFAWSLAVGLPQVWWVMQASGVETRSFVAWSVGWDRGDQHVLAFWLRNTGALIPIVAAALLWRGNPPIVSPALRRFYLPFVLCFVVPNLFRLAPWIWDNVKILVYWFLASVPLVALVLARLWRGGSWRAALAALLLVSLTLAGALDLWRVASGAFQNRVFDSAGIEFARHVAARTEPRAMILHAPMPNHPIALTGRRSLMGYPGHVWSHGLDPGPREADIRSMYAGGAEAEPLLARYGVEYVVLDPPGLRQVPADEQFFERYERVVEAHGYRLFRIERGAR